MRRLLPALLALGTAALLAALWLQVPGVNGPWEWRWDYRPPGLGGAGLAILAACAGLAIAATLRDGGRFAGSRTGLGLLVLLGCGLTLAVVDAQPGGFGRVIRSLVSRHSFSYVFDAGVAPGTAELLADYPAASERLDLHSQTHPPGPLLLVRGLDALTRGLPVPEGGLVAAARDAFAREVNRARERRRPAPEVPAGPWAVVILAFLLPALSALAAWPLHRLALSWGLSPGAAALAVLLWLLTPARSLFTPSLDQALPLLLVGAAALASLGDGREPGGGRARSFGAGLLAAAACFLSYGCLAILPWLALLTLGAGPDERPGWRARSGGVRAGLLGAGFLVPWIVLALATGYAPWRAFRVAISAHRTMAVVTRSYSTWVGWNLYDFALLLGPAVALLALAALRPGPAARSFRWGLWGFWGLLLLLDLSGSVRGEVGRIWLFFMPLACLFAAAALAEREGEDRRPAGVVGGLALLQAALLLTLAANLVFVS
ncbi:MAG: methylthioxylose transferase [Acidobacteriota bacterium]|nr:methylthioxylose transferase [Acidobacteriota bacterium]